MKFIFLTKNEWIALGIPLLALALHTLAWPFVKPHIWFAFYTSLYFSARIGGERGGIYATFFTAILVYIFELKPIFSLIKTNLGDYISMLFFIFVGIAFSKMQGKLEQKLVDLKLASIAFESKEGIVITDKEGIIQRANEMYCQITGYTHEEIIGQKPSVLRSNQQDKSFYQEMWKQIDNHQVWDGELINKRKNGEIFPAHLVITQISDEQGAIVNYVGIMTDITEQKKGEEELKRAKLLAEEATRTKSEFLANMSHEIRTPMNAILGLTGLALDSCEDVKQKDYLTKINSSSKALLHILNDILDYSKMEAGKLEILEEHVIIEEVLQNIADLFVIPIEKKGLELFFEVDENVPIVVLGDHLRLTQVLNNLVSNAIKFTEQGEIHIRVEVAQMNDNYTTLRFSVRDTGIGLNKAQSDRLFAAFSQADNSITRKYGGTGLGLSISQKLINLMGGTIVLSSQVGVGSTFSFTINCKKVDEEEARKDYLHFLHEKNALIVDDQETSLTILRHYLESWGMTVQSATSGKEALEKIIQATHDNKFIDLLLTDWKMPKMDGVELLQQIEVEAKKGTIKPITTVIMVSGYAKEMLIEKLGSTPIDGFATKPIIQSDLFNEIIKNHIPHYIQHHEKEPQKISSEYARSFLNGKKILLVEDNELNQQVATEILKKAGVIVSVAENGQEGVDKVFHEDFDAILMDMQMPIMDGLEATKIIRADKKFATLPIIAMTAAALNHDKEACLSSGMDYHIAKPIIVNELFEVLIRYIGEESSSVPLEQEKPVAHEEFVTLPDVIEGIESYEALERFDGDKALYAKFLLHFSQNYRSKGETLLQLTHHNNIPLLTSLVHEIKGVSGNLGLKSLYEQAQQCENYLRHHNSTQDMALLVTKLESICNIIDNNVVYKTTHKEKRNTEKIQEILQEFLLNVHEKNFLSDEKRELYESVTQTILDNEDYKELWRKVDNFHYTEIENMLINLLKKESNEQL